MKSQKNYQKQQFGFTDQDLQLLRELSTQKQEFDTLKGNNPSSWSENIEEFIEQLQTRQVFFLINEPRQNQKQFFIKARQELASSLTNFKENNDDNNKQEILKHISNIMKVLLLVNLQKADYLGIIQFLVEDVQILHQYVQEKQQLDKIEQELQNSFENFYERVLQQLKKDKSDKIQNYMHTIDELGGFSIIKNKIFGIQGTIFQKSSITTDGTYIYIIVGATNGGMFKIGSGQNNTLQGHVYFEKPVFQGQNVSWVYLNDNLYLQSSSNEVGFLDIIDPQTFANKGQVQINTKDLFGTPDLQILNKNFQLLTEGKNLYIIGKSIQIEKQEITEEQQKLIKQKLEQKIKVYQNQLNFSIQHCNKGHKLQYIDKKTIQERGITCDLCSSRVKDKGCGTYRCETCDFDRCENCYNKEQERFIQRIKNSKQNVQNFQCCTQNHSLQFYDSSTQRRKFHITCDCCGVMIKDKNLGTYRCQQCDYDRCERCYIIEGENQLTRDIIQKEQKFQNIEREILIREKQEEYGSKKCLNNHNLLYLEPYQQQQKNIFCDICKCFLRKLPIGSYQCQKCDFDRCEKCYNILQQSKDQQICKSMEFKDELFRSQAQQLLYKDNSIVKYLEFHLYQFKKDQLQNKQQLDSCNSQGEINDLKKQLQELSKDQQELVQELYGGYSQIFSLQQCLYALIYSNYDIQAAAEYLFEERDHLNNISNLVVNQPEKKILLSKSVILNDSRNSSSQKLSGDITVQGDSVIFPQNILNNVWTVKDQVLALYTENGVKLFDLQKEQKKQLLLLQQQKSENNNNTNIGCYMQDVESKKYLDKSLNKHKFNQNPSYSVCYDNVNKRYIQLLWNINNVTATYSFPSKLAFSYDHSSYEKLIPSQVKNDHQNFYQFSLGKLLEFQKIRHQLPWVLNRWDITYQQQLIYLSCQQNNSVNKNQKQKIQNKIQKLGKNYFMDNQRNQVFKMYALNINGGEEEGQYLLKLKQIFAQNQFNQGLVQLHYQVFQSHNMQKQEKLVLDSVQKIQHFIRIQDSIIQDGLILTEKAQEIKDLSLIRNGQKVQQQVEISLNQKQIQQILQQYIQSIKQQDLASQQDLNSCLLLLYRQEQEEKFLNNKNFVYILYKFYQESLESILGWNTRKKTIQQQQSQLVFQLIQYSNIYMSNSYQQFCNEFSQIMINILNLYHKLTSKNNYLDSNNLGLDMTEYRGLESGHPYERGCVVCSDSISFQDAIALYIEFDARTQTEQNIDFITITGQYDQDLQLQQLQQQQQVASGQPKKQGIGNYFKLSGKIQENQRQFVLLGNVMNIDFISSAKAKNVEQSLNFWGFKLKAYPIYGVQNQKKNKQNQNAFIVYHINLIKQVQIYSQSKLMSKLSETNNNIKLQEKDLRGFKIDQFLESTNIDNKEQYKFISNQQQHECSVFQDIQDYNFILENKEQKVQSFNLKNLEFSKYFSNKDNEQDVQIVKDLQAIKQQKQQQNNGSNNILEIVESVNCIQKDSFRILTEKKRQNFQNYSKLFKFSEQILVYAIGFQLGLDFDKEQENNQEIMKKINQYKQKIIQFYLDNQFQNYQEIQYALTHIQDILNTKYIQKIQKQQQQKLEKEKEQNEQNLKNAQKQDQSDKNNNQQQQSQLGVSKVMVTIKKKGRKVVQAKRVVVQSNTQQQQQNSNKNNNNGKQSKKNKKKNNIVQQQQMQQQEQQKSRKNSQQQQNNLERLKDAQSSFKELFELESEQELEEVKKQLMSFYSQEKIQHLQEFLKINNQENLQLQHKNDQQGNSSSSQIFDLIFQKLLKFFIQFTDKIINNSSNNNNDSKENKFILQVNELPNSYSLITQELINKSLLLLMIQQQKNQSQQNDYLEDIYEFYSLDIQNYNQFINQINSRNRNIAQQVISIQQVQSIEKCYQNQFNSIVSAPEAILQTKNQNQLQEIYQQQAVSHIKNMAENLQEVLQVQLIDKYKGKKELYKCFICAQNLQKLNNSLKKGRQILSNILSFKTYFQKNTNIFGSQLLDKMVNVQLFCQNLLIMPYSQQMQQLIYNCKRFVQLVSVFLRHIQGEQDIQQWVLKFLPSSSSVQNWVNDITKIQRVQLVFQNLLCLQDSLQIREENKEILTNYLNKLVQNCRYPGIIQQIGQIQKKYRLVLDFGLISAVVGNSILIETQQEKQQLEFQEQAQEQKEIKENQEEQEEEEEEEVKQEKQDQEVVLIGYLNEEEDLSYLLRVFYQWEKQNPTFSLKFPKTIEEDIKFQQMQQQAQQEQKQQQQQSSSEQSLQEGSKKKQLLGQDNLIRYNLLENWQEEQDQDQLLGYGMNFNNLGDNQNQLNFSNKSINQGAKQWANNILAKMKQKYDDLDRHLEDQLKKMIENLRMKKIREEQEKTMPKGKDEKESDTKIQSQQQQQEKAGKVVSEEHFVELRNFVRQVKIHLQTILKIAQNFNNFGFSALQPAQKLQQKQHVFDLCKLIYDCKEKNLEEVRMPSHFPEEFKKIYSPQNLIQQLTQGQQQQQFNLQLTIVTKKMLRNLKQHSKCIFSEQYPIYNQNNNLNISQPQNKFIFKERNNYFVQVNEYYQMFNHINNGQSLEKNSFIGESQSVYIQNMIQLGQQVIRDTDVQNSFQNLNELLQSQQQQQQQQDQQLQENRARFLGVLNIISGYWVLSLGQNNEINREYKILYNSGQQQAYIYNRQNNQVQKQSIQEIKEKVYDQYVLKKQPQQVQLSQQQLVELLQCYIDIQENNLNLNNQIGDLVIQRCILKVMQVQDLSNIQNNNEKLWENLVRILQGLEKEGPTNKNGVSYQFQLSDCWQNLYQKKSRLYKEQAILNESLLHTLQQQQQQNNNANEVQQRLKLRKKSNISDFNGEECGVLENEVNLQLSNYNTSLPQFQEQVQENKLLKYWEKHVIPKIIDFVKSSFKPYEMEEFFEQMRIPLRMGDQNKAAQVAYILCDNKLPSGVQLLDPNHDYSSLSFEDLKIGQFALISLKKKGLFEHFIFNKFQDLGVEYLCVQILNIDTRTQSVLTIFQDSENRQFLPLWVPLSCLKNVEVSMKQGGLFSYTQQQLEQKYLKSLKQNNSILARQILLKISQSLQVQLNQQNQNIKIIDTIKYTIQEELSQNPIESWKIHSQYPSPNQNILRIQENLYKSTNNIQQIEELILYCKQSFQDLVQYIHTSRYQVNLLQDSVVNLNQFPSKKQISCIIINFFQDSQLCIASGLNFSTDEQGQYCIKSLHSGKSIRKNLQPIVFNEQNVYSKYYYNSDSLPPYERLQIQQNTKLNSVIYGVPSDWILLSWLVDNLSNAIFYKFQQQKDSQQLYTLLKQINTVLAQTQENLRGPCEIKQQLYVLLTRNSKKLLKIKQCYSSGQDQLEFFGISQQFIKQQINISEDLKQKFGKSQQGLYSSYIQDQVECIATLLTPLQIQKNPQDILDGFKIPQYILKIINLNVMINYFYSQQQQNLQMSQQLQDKFVQNLSQKKWNQQQKQIKEEKQQGNQQGQQDQSKQQVYLEYICENILIVRNIHGSIQLQNQEGESFKGLMEILEENNVVIDNADTDIHLVQNLENNTYSCLILIYGWKQPEDDGFLEEDSDNDTNDNLEMKEEPPEIPMPAHPEFYNCQVCTLENLWINETCEICEAPRPEMEQPQEPEVMIQDGEDNNNNNDNGGNDDGENLKQQKLRKKRHQIQKKYLGKNIDRFLQKQLLVQSEQLQKHKLRQQQLQEKIQDLEEQLKKVQEQKKNQQQDKDININDQLQEIFQAGESDMFKDKFMEILKDKDIDLGDIKLKLLEQIGKDKSQKKDNNNNDKEEEEQKVEDFDEIIKDLENKIKEAKQKLQDLEKEKSSIEELVLQQEKPVFYRSFEDIMQVVDNQIIITDFLRQRIFQDHDLELKFEVKQVLISIFSEIQQQMNSNQQQNPTDQKEYQSYLLTLLPKQEIPNNNDDYANNIQGILQDQREFIQFWLNVSKDNIYELYQFILNFGYDFQFQQVRVNQLETLEKLDRDQLVYLLQFIENQVLQVSEQVLQMDCQDIRFSPYQNSVNYPKYQQQNASQQFIFDCLENNQKTIQLKYNWNIIKTFNLLLQEALPFIHIQSCQNQSQQQQDLSMGGQLSNLRNLWMRGVKSEFQQNVLQKTSNQRENLPKITVERFKIQQNNIQKQQPNKINNNNQENNNVVSLQNKDDFIFTLAYEQLRNVHPSNLRPVKPQGTDPFLAFEVILQGESAQGESGPYRQFFADISLELQQQNNNNQNSNNKQMNLLVPCQNSVDDFGDQKDKFVVNEQAGSKYCLELYEFLGVLMGICIRTNVHLTLDLPAIFWKQLVEQEVNLQDYMEIDVEIQNMKKQLDSVGQEMFQTEESQDLYEDFIKIIDKEEEEENNKFQFQFESRYQILQKLLQIKVKKTHKQVQAIKRGLQEIIPSPLLKTLSCKELENWICGQKIVDVALLKRHTEYSGGLDQNSQIVKFFWEAFEEFDNGSKLKFIKFCWGQERLPRTDDDFVRNQTRFLIKPLLKNNKNQQYQDQSLPKADTCFFNLELPNYSSKQILKKQIMIAINFDCDAIDADQVVHLDPNAAAYFRRDDRSSFDYRDEQW